MENNFKTAKQPEFANLERSRFGLHEAALACVVFIILNLIFTTAISGINISGLAGTIWYYLLQIGVEAMFAFAALFVAGTRNLSFIEDTGMKNKISWKMVGWCFLVSLASLMFFGNLTNVFIEIIQYFGYESILGGIEINTFGQYIGMVIASCVSAAFCEEVLFRGVILSGFRKCGFKIAVVMSSLIFMLMHGNAEQTVHQFIVGLIVGVVFYTTGNLWIGVLIHFFNNLIPITQVYMLTVYAGSITETTTTAAVATATTTGFGTIVIDLIMAVLFAWVGFMAMKWLFSKIYAENTKLNGEYKEAGNKTAVVIDGTETTIDMTIDGVELQETKEENTPNVTVKPKVEISKATIIMFAIAGIYLVGNWLLYTVYGFII